MADKRSKSVSLSPEARAIAAVKQRRQEGLAHGAKIRAWYARIARHRERCGPGRAEVKASISSGKAISAILTAGFSLLATGLARKHRVTKAVARRVQV